MKTYFKRQRSHRENSSGFTLLELMIALGVSCILVLGLTKIYSSVLRSYSMQDQLTEMNQNAKFVMEELSDVLMQVGASCAAVNSDTTDKDTIIKPTGSPCSDFTVKVNPRGGLFVITSRCSLNTLAARCSLQVDSANPFRNATLLEKIPCQTPPTARAISIYSLDSIHTTSNYIYFHSSSGSAKDTFYVNDAICSFVNHRYYLNGTSLCLDSAGNVLAENIDSLKISFFDPNGNALTLAATPTLWAKVWSMSIMVESTTSLPDNAYNGYSDHRHRLKLSYQFRLKNKV